MRRLNRVFGLALFIFLAACTKNSSNSGSAANDNVILIGQFGSMTGGEATFGQSTEKGVRLAIDAKKAAGGIKGKKIVLKTEDDQGKPEEAAAVVKKLITQDKVMAIL